MSQRCLSLTHHLFIHQYPDAFEEIDPTIPEPFGPAILTSIFFDSDLAHDLRTHRSCTGIVVFIGRMPVSWSSKRQTSIQTSNYGAEFMAGKTACKEAISLRYILRCLGVRIKGQTNLYGDNKGMLQSSMLIDSECKKLHLAIAHHKMRECVAAGMINPIKIHTDHNIRDFLMKTTDWGTHHYHTGAFFGQWLVGAEVDILMVKL